MDNASLGELLGRVTAIEAALATLIAVSPDRDRVLEALRQQSAEIAKMAQASSGEDSAPVLAGWNRAVAQLSLEGAD